MSKEQSTTEILGVYKKNIIQTDMSFDVSLYKRKALEVLRQFDIFCTKHHLAYSIAYGTLLGAIRHKGFIPWDDDIDVVMPRKDYDRFISLTMSGMSDGYNVISCYTSPTYYLRFAKVLDCNTTLIETKSTKNCPIGVFVDVFPIDAFGLSEKTTLFLGKKIRRYSINAMLLLINPFKERRGLKTCLKWVLLKCLQKKPQQELIKADKLSKKFSGSTVPRVLFYGDSSILSNSFPCFLFDEIIDYKFEDINFKGFRKADAYLTNLYGDYMKLPPVELQVSHHYHYFVDLDRSWTIEELKEVGII